MWAEVWPRTLTERGLSRPRTSFVYPITVGTNGLHRLEGIVQWQT